MYRNNVEMRVLVNGHAVKEYSHRGMTLVESRHGSNYTIKIKNDNGFRVMAVVSVDGLDVITGKPAENSNKGYIVDAYSSTEIKGYRTSDSNSAAFVFISKDQSYVAGVSGDSRNSGVVGIRVFEEKPEKKEIVKIIEHHHHDHYYPKDPWNPYPYKPWEWPYVPPVKPIWPAAEPIWRINNASAAPSTPTCNLSAQGGAGGTKFASGPNTLNGIASNNSFDSPIQYDAFDTGTTWGQSQTDVVRREYFRKGKLLTEIVIYYASSEALKNMGVDLNDTPKIAEGHAPKAFGNSQYCQPPRGWQG